MELPELDKFRKQIQHPEMDKDIDDPSIITTYLGIITENIRENNQIIRRNSFLIVICIALFFLFKFNIIEKFTAGGLELSNKVVILSGVVVIYSFLYLTNVARWYHNNELRLKFDMLSTKLFNLGITSRTTQIIKPFSLMFHTLDFQSERKDLNFLLRLPSLTAHFIILFGPSVLQLYFIVNLIVFEKFDFFSVSAIVISFLLFVITLIYAAKSE